MMVLTAEIEPDFECLVDVQVPFVEDVRPFQFPPLGTVRTVSGRTLDQHRHLPTPAMDQLMSDYVDSMDLSQFGTDEYGCVSSAALPLPSCFSC